MSSINPIRLDPNLLLRTQVYEFLRDNLKSKALKPGMFVSINRLVEQTGISRTPLREALLQLQNEGFVTLLPQRGIRINELTPKDIEDIYEIMGALDSRSLMTVFHRITAKDIKDMKRINEAMMRTVGDKESNRYFDLNSEFHNVYLKYSENQLLLNQLSILRQRLFEFGSKGEWIEKVRMLNYTEHLTLIDLIDKGKVREACDFIRETHCSVNWNDQAGS
jgi:DNA-binding GntR family transcriptional regulator